MIDGFIIFIHASENIHSLIYSVRGDNCSGLRHSWCKLIVFVISRQFFPTVCFYTEFIKIIAGFVILVVISSKHIQCIFKRKHTHVLSRLRKRIGTIGDHDPVLRLCVQGVEVVVIYSLTPLSTKDVEIFFNEGTTMKKSSTWWITCSIQLLEGLVVGIIQLDIIFITTIKTTEQINRPHNQVCTMTVPFILHVINAAPLHAG